MTDSAATLLKAMDEAATAVAVLTGIRAQFIEAGWTQVTAEIAVLEMFRASNK